MNTATKTQSNNQVLSRTEQAIRNKIHSISTLQKVTIIFFFLLTVSSMIFVNTQATKTLDYIVGAFGTIPFIYFLIKMKLSFFYQPYTKEPEQGLKVSAVVPSFNEFPEAVLKTIQCLIEQDYPLHEIIFVDDGSKDLSAYHAVQKFAQEYNEIRQAQLEVAVTGESRLIQSLPKLIVHRFEKNKGKRSAQAWGFRQATGDFFLIVDSDGYLYPNAVRELLKPFHDKSIQAVTGHVNARNREENFLTKLQDILYESAFRVGRGAMTVLGGSVIVCSGAISMFRREVVMDNLDKFENDMMFGKPNVIGDDRRLTTFSLAKGKAVYQSTARCLTDVPTSIKKFFKQQVRWNKSTYIESIRAFPLGLKKPAILMFLIGEGFLWLVFGTSMVYSWIFNLVNLHINLLIYSIGYLILTALAGNIYYFIKRPFTFLCSPIFSVVQMLILFPVRLYALFTLKSNGWGTR